MCVKNQNITCPFCKQRTGRKHGFRATVTEGKKQRFQCRECGKTWYEEKNTESNNEHFYTTTD